MLIDRELNMEEIPKAEHNDLTKEMQMPASKQTGRSPLTVFEHNVSRARQQPWSLYDVQYGGGAWSRGSCA
jgi:hypothetical protein